MNDNSTFIKSHLNPDNSADNKVTKRLQRYASDDQGVPYRIREQGTNKSRVEDLHDDHDGGRQRHEQHHGEAPLRRVDTDLAQNFEAFTDYIGQVVKNLGQIAAG